MSKLTNDEHDYNDFANEDERPTYVLSGQVMGIEFSRASALVVHLEDSITGQWRGFINVNSNLRQVTGYEYITEAVSELDSSIEIQRLIENAIRQFTCLH